MTLVNRLTELSGSEFKKVIHLLRFQELKAAERQADAEGESNNINGRNQVNVNLFAIRKLLQVSRQNCNPVGAQQGPQNPGVLVSGAGSNQTLSVVGHPHPQELNPAQFLFNGLLHDSPDQRFD